ncbi:MAG: rhomboid family intramembrane serine protease [Planctomycetota bacterium]
MRQVGKTLPAAKASLLADILLAEGIKSNLLESPEGIQVWIVDEDKLPRARELLASFQANPMSADHAAARSEARKIRNEEQSAEREYEQRQRRMERRMRGAARDKITLLVVLVSVGVSLFSISAASRQETSEPMGTPEQVVSFLSFADPMGQPTGGAIPWNQPWRMVTPAFLHFSTIHLLFNMLMLISLGTRVERALGPPRYGALLLGLALASNLAQGLMVPDGMFGGMSGVVYGIFGFSWIQMSRAPGRGLAIDGFTAMVMMAWFFAGFLQLTGGVSMANHAHAGGLLAGLLAGYLWTE